MPTSIPDSYDFSRPLPNHRQERFCLAIVQGVQIYKAYLVAGYKGKGMRATLLRRRPQVNGRIEALFTKAAEQAVNSNAVTRDEIIESLRDTRKTAKRGTPILDRNGEPTGEFKLSLSDANRSDEILAKMHGFMVDVQRKDDLDSQLDGMTPDDLKAFVLSLVEQLDPNIQKQVLAQVDAAVPDEEIEEEKEKGPVLQ